MYERRHAIGDGGAFDEQHSDVELAAGYRELTMLYKLYQEAVFQIDRRYVPQVTGVNEYAPNRAIELMFEEREKALTAREAIPVGTAVDRDQRDVHLRELRATLANQRATFATNIMEQWLAFERICIAIADNVYVKQFYHKPLFTSQAERITPIPFFPTQESRLSQYQVPNGLVYYNGKPYTLGNDWNAKRAQILDKLLSFENPFP